ncbi:MAG: hypothetical protein IKZ53_09320 [Selenomonadaceae bacterium]|nr:hypothetical protein [Selenomonadaceae bacterium]
MKKILAAIILLLLTNTVAAKGNGAEIRTFDATPEFIIKHKNISVDCIDNDFFKLKFDKEIFSLMGTGIEWNISLNAVNENFAVLPSVGVNLYMRIKPRLDIYTQFSGLPLGRRGHVTDFESGIKYFPQKNFSISAGWREINFKLRRGGDSSNFNLRGLFAGVRYDF